MADPTPSRSPGRKTGQGATSPASEAFDLWLRRGLEALYGAGLREPVSQELLQIIEADRRRREGGIE